MLGNYLTTALRLLWRERGYAAINIFGLAVGFALCLLIIQLAAYQLSVGDFHEKKDRVYRVLGPKFLQASGYSGALPIELGPTLKEQLPEVEEAVRFTSNYPRLLRVGAKDAISEEVLTAEAGVFDVFSFPLPARRPEDGLGAPLHHGANRAVGPSALRRERSHWTGRPLRRKTLIARLPASSVSRPPVHCSSFRRYSPLPRSTRRERERWVLGLSGPSCS